VHVRAALLSGILLVDKLFRVIDTVADVRLEVQQCLQKDFEAGLPKARAIALLHGKIHLQDYQKLTELDLLQETMLQIVVLDLDGGLGHLPEGVNNVNDQGWSCKLCLSAACERHKSDLCFVGIVMFVSICGGILCALSDCGDCMHYYLWFAMIVCIASVIGMLAGCAKKSSSSNVHNVHSNFHAHALQLP